MSNKSNKVKWIAVSLGAAVLILLLLLFWQNGELKNHTAGKLEQQRRADSVQSRLDRSDRTAAELMRMQAGKNRLIDTLNVELSQTKKQLSQVVSKNMNLADQVKIAKSLKDTGLYIASCDSLVEENKNLYVVLDQYTTVTDSLMGAISKSARYSDSIAAEKTKLNEFMRDSFKASDSAYNALYKDRNKTVKKLKTQRVITKVSAGVGLAAVILVALLK